MSLILTQTAFDNFTRANENPLSQGGNWISDLYGDSPLQIVTDLCEGSELSGSASLYSVSLPNNQYAQVTIAAVVAGGDAISPGIRITDNGAEYYSLTGYVLDTTTYSNDYFLHAGGSIIASGSISLAVSDTLAVAAVGSTIYALHNGTQLVAVTNTNYASGIAALGLSPESSISDTRASLFSVGSASIGSTISGNAGVASATISWTGTSSGSVTADGSGNFTTSGLANGSYTLTPSKTGYTFSPTSRSETISGSNITEANFTASAVAAVWSQPDDRDYAMFPNNEITVQGTETYTIPAHPSHTTPIDSRKAKPVDSRQTANIPENSRTNPVGHE
jgi:hypothetical protein